MARPPRDLDRILEMARLHYEDRLTQAEIAREMSVSVATVSRHLRQASLLGLVETRVASSAYRDFAVEGHLMRRLGLASACVVRSAGSSAATERVLAGAAARKLDEFLASGAVVGVSNGRTLAAVAGEARRTRNADLDVVTLIGGIGRAETSSQTGEICRTLADRLGGRAWILPVPAVVEFGGHGRGASWIECGGRGVLPDPPAVGCRVRRRLDDPRIVDLPARPVRRYPPRRHGCTGRRRIDLRQVL